MKKEIEKVFCACGCGEIRPKLDKRGRARKYLVGHRNRFKKEHHYSLKTEFKKGQVPWNVGLTKETNEIIQKMSMARKGMLFTKKHCTNISKSKKGVPNPKLSQILMGKIREKSRNWHGGKSFEPYGPEFNEKLRELVRARDNHKCHHCLEKQTKEKLAVHHIDYNKKNNMLSNLISFCRKHHTLTNAHRRFWKDYLSFVIQRRFGNEERNFARI